MKRPFRLGEIIMNPTNALRRLYLIGVLVLIGIGFYLMILGLSFIETYWMFPLIALQSLSLIMCITEIIWLRSFEDIVRSYLRRRFNAGG